MSLAKQAHHQLQATIEARAQAGDFDFLTGHWKIQHRQLTSTKPDVWDSFDGEASCWSILNGTVSIEELRIPARDFSGMGLRILNQEKMVWTDFWVNAKRGNLLAPGVEGGFCDGRGVFIENTLEDEQHLQIRGVWDNITSTTCRWEQASSSDGGQTWQTNWTMDWVRIK